MLLTGNARDWDLSALRGATNQADGDGAGILGGKRPDNLVSRSGSDDLSGSRRGDRVKVCSLRKDRRGQGQRGRDDRGSETHFDKSWIV